MSWIVPRDQKQPIFDFSLFMRTTFVSVIILAGAYSVFMMELDRNDENSIAEARTAVVNTVVAVASAYLVNCRSLRGDISSIGWFTNPPVLFGIGITILFQLAFTYAPLMNRFLHRPIGLEVWGRIMGIAVLAFVLVELRRRSGRWSIQ